MYIHSSYRFLFITIIFILGMATIGAYIITSTRPPADAPIPFAPTETPVSPTPPPPSEQSIAPKRNNLSYSQAINLYSKSRIQFDSYCQANPSSLTIKSITPLMLDNRSDSSRSITIDGASRTLLPYGFTVVTVPFQRLPHTAIINCGSSKNSARVNIVR
ncbi:MAG: hypothetical protein RIQ54_280 [Candidatus Parcubacteria bacterium]|jgi:hypothetical protein